MKIKISAFLKRSKIWIILNCLTAFIMGLVTIYFSVITKNLTDMAINKQISKFINYLYITIFILVISIIIGYIKEYSALKYKSDFAYNIRNSVIKQVINLPIHIKEKYHSGDLVSRINSDVDLISELVGLISVIVINPVMFIAAVIYLFNISWKLLLCSVVLMPLTGYLFNKFSKPLEKKSRLIMEEQAKINSLAKDTINGVYILKSFSLENILLNKYQNNIDEIVKNGLKINKIGARLTRLFLALRYIPQLIVPLFGGYLAIKGEITVGELLASTQLIWFVFTPIEALLNLQKQIRVARPAINRVCEVLNEKIENQTSEVFYLGDPSVKFANVYFGYNDENLVLKNINFELKAGSTTAIVGSSGVSNQMIEMKAASFSYENDKKVLNNINLSIAEGNMTAIVGTSGGGKSTILKLLMRFYDADNGEIYVNGKSIHSRPLRELRDLFAYVPQDAYLFMGTIEENISYGKIGASKEEIIEAAKRAYAHDFIVEFPNGYKTIVEEGSNNLSGGQKQRIAIARAILKNAPILLLDEATSALDSESEQLVQLAINCLMKGKTTLVIAHKLSTIEAADEIFVLKKGEIVEKGSHKELISMKGLYNNLYDFQFKC